MEKCIVFPHNALFDLILYFKQMVNDREYIVLCFTCVLFGGQFGLPKYKMCKTFDSADPFLGSYSTEKPKHMLNALQTNCSLWNYF